MTKTEYTTQFEGRTSVFARIAEQAATTPTPDLKSYLEGMISQLARLKGYLAACDPNETERLNELEIVDIPTCNREVAICTNELERRVKV
jgi:hypothetical protein